jgi:hypothetical protein
MKQVKTRARDCRIRLVRGRPTVTQGHRPVSEAVYCDYILRGDWKERNADFAGSGVQVYHLTQAHGAQGLGIDFFDNAFWPDDGVYPADDSAYEYSLDHQAGTLIGLAPEARFYIKFNLSPPLRWTQAHTGEMSTDETGKTYREASWSSARYLRDLARYVSHLVGYCESRPWAGRILGYMALPYGEGLSLLNIAGKWFDCSAANEAAFRAYLRRTYGSLEALRQAWKEPGLTWEEAKIPRDREWLARRREGEATIKGVPLSKANLSSNCGVAPRGLFHFIEAGNAVREHDYCRFMRENFRNWVGTVIAAVRDPLRRLSRERLFSIDITKQPLLGWPIMSSFDGVGDAREYPNILTLSGSWDVGSLLDHPDLDGLWTPADYTARTLGFAYEPEGVSDSLVLRGKLMFCENDQRTYVGAGMQEQGAFRDDAEVEAGLLRNAAMSLSRGFQSYWCNVGSSYFHAPGIQKTVGKLTRMLDRLQGHPHRETRDAIALVIDDQSAFCEDLTSGYQALAVIWQRVCGLAHCGVPYRILLLSDLERENLPPYRTWVFPNLFKVDAQVIRLLKKSVLRDGNVAIFGPATGISDGRHLGAEGASELLGVPFELHARSTVRHVIVQDSGHPISRELPASLVYGDSLPYGPTLTPVERGVETSGAVVLGHANLCWFIHRSGLFLKEFGRGPAGNGRRGARGTGDYGVVWSVAVPLPAGLLRACARHAGSHIWCEEDDVIYASDSLVSIHSVKAGARTLRLPRACRVTDALSGRPVGKGKVREIRLRIAPPQTRIFTLT